MMVVLALVELCGCYITPTEDALRPDPSARERLVQWIRQADGTWAIQPEPIAWNWSSLDAAVIDGELVLAGLNHAHPVQAWEEPLRHPLAEALVTSDGKTWKGRRYWGLSHMGGVDPAIVHDGDGWSIWIVRVEGRDADPSDPGQQPRFMRAALRGGIAGTLEAWATTDAIVDVMPVFFQGRLHVYGTRHSREVVEVQPDGSYTTVWAGATVPYARVVGDTLELVAQVGTRFSNFPTRVLVGGEWRDSVIPFEDRRLPYVRRSVDGSTWSEPELLDIGTTVRNCASPVLVNFLDVDRLFCVDEQL